MSNNKKNNTAVLKPDDNVHTLEEKVIKEQTNAVVARVKAKGPFDEHLPARPAFGDKGKSIVVFANYFCITAKARKVYKYGLKVTKVISEEQKKGKGFKESDVRGRKLQLVIAKFIEEIRNGGELALNDALKQEKKSSRVLSKAQKQGNDETIASAEEELARIRANIAELRLVKDEANKRNNQLVSEFKSQIVSLEPLAANQSSTRVVLSEPSIEDNEPPREEHFDVALLEPTEVDLADITKYVASMVVAKDDSVFPRHPEIVDVLNMILGFRPRSNMDGVSVVGGSKFYALGADKQIASLGIERPIIAARGFFQSARSGTGRLLLNTQVTHGVFKSSGPATELWNARFGGTPGTRPQNKFAQLKWCKTFSKGITKARAVVTFKTESGREVKRVKTVEGLVFSTDFPPKPKPEQNRCNPLWELCGPKHVEFWIAKEKRYTTVHKHFKDKYDMELGDYPLFKFGSGETKSYFPAELVQIQEGQQAKLKLTGQETTNMLDFACRSPFSNATSLTQESHHRLGHDDDILGQFGVTVSKDLLTVHARVFTAPSVLYGIAPSKHNPKKMEPTVTLPRFGSWNMVGCKVAKPGIFTRWAYVTVEISGSRLTVTPQKIDQMIAFWQDMGIKIESRPTMDTRTIQGAHQLEDLFNAAEQKDLELIIFVLTARDSGGIYNKIKTLGDCRFGIHTACMVHRQIHNPKGDAMTFANLGLKINLKAGGTNHKLSKDLDIMRDGNTMFVGYDVTHPTNMEIPKGGALPPSLVGLVSSIDRDLGQWPSVTWEQSSKQEMLSNMLETQFCARLQLWKNKNPKNVLKNIVIYRDGVSEGQFSLVLMHELPMIRSACKKVYGDQRPKVTLIVSVKRHQTRFYPTSFEERSRSGNITSGTIVDRGVTQVRYWDFYLTAHEALKGTARPAHYTVLLDEIFRPRYGKEAANELEKVTHELCYLFGRATKAVSICPPAYYADLVCERARAHRPEFAGSDAGSEVSGSGPPSVWRDINRKLQNSMFYI